MNKSLILDRRLGRWADRKSNWLWEAVHDLRTGDLWVTDGESITRRYQRRGGSFEESEMEMQAPERAVPVKVWKNGERLEPRGACPREQEASMRPPASFTEVLGDLPYHVRHTLGMVSLPVNDGANLHNDICSGSLRVKGASDGLVKDGDAAHAWVMEGSE